jgi:predicted DNA-binding transcriptional regulator AlpA
MSAEAVAEMMMIHTRTLRKIVAEDSTFPKPIMIGPRMTRWRLSELKQWIDSKK